MGICTYIFSLITSYLVVRIIYIGVKFGDTQPGIRETLARWAMTVATFFMLVVGLGIIPKSTHKKDVDYSKWLGPDFIAKSWTPENPGIRPGAIVSNHMSFVDAVIMLYVKKADISFIVGSHLQNVPFIGGLCQFL